MDQSGAEYEIKHKVQEGHPAEDDLSRWSHHPELATVQDKVMRKAGEGLVSFIFACEIEGKELEVEQTTKESKVKLKRLPKPIGGSLRVRNGASHDTSSTNKEEGVSQCSSELRKRKLEALAPVLKRMHTQQP